MSGHSKWSSIKHKKGAADKKRGQLFSKLSRALIVAAREGGPDPAANLALQNAIEKAKSYSMPKDNIDRAIARGAGTDADAAAYETVVYEGYGAGGVAVLVEALTDNRNRTASDVRHRLHEERRQPRASGAVAWQFERRGIVLVPADGADEDELMLAAADGGAEDVERDGSSFQITAAWRTWRACARRSKRPASPSRAPSSRWCRRRRSRSTTRARRRRSCADRLAGGERRRQDVYSNSTSPEGVLETVAG